MPHTDVTHVTIATAMNISLHPDLQKFIDDQLAAGHYESADALINTALARLQSENHSADDLAELRAEIEVAIAQADRGELEDWDIHDIRAEGQRLLSESRKKAV